MNPSKTERFTAISAYSILAFIIYYFFMLQYGTQIPALNRFAKNNMVMYASALLVFAAVFFILTATLKHSRFSAFLCSEETLLTPSQQKRFLCVALSIAFLLWFHSQFFAKGALYAAFDEDLIFFATQNVPILGIVYVFGCILCITIGLRYAKSGKDFSEKCVWITYIVAALLEFYNEVFLDIFNYFHLSPDIFGQFNRWYFADVHHATAYRETIYNVYYHVPFTSSTSGIYGHYGLFFAPWMYLFKGSPIALSILVAVISLFADILCFYIIHQLTKKNWLRCISSFAVLLPLAIWQRRNYWQGYPHRVIFTFLILALFFYLSKKNLWNRRTHIFMYFLGMLSVVWNTETGIFCLLGMSAVFAIHFWQTHNWNERAFWLYLAKLIVASGLAVIGAICVVNIYNLSCGGPLILKDFFFPLFSSDFMEGTLAIKAPVGNHYWVYILITFALLLLYGLYHTKLFESSDKMPFMAPITGIAVFGLLHITYFFNRAAYTCMSLAIYPFIFALCYFCDLFLSDWRILFREKRTRFQSCKSIFGALCVSILVYMSLNAAVIIPKSIITVGRWDTTQINHNASLIAEMVPKNTFAIGNGLTEIYALLGWDTQAHYRDFSDLYVGGNAAADAILEETLLHDDFLFYSGQNDEGKSVIEAILAADPTYHLVADAPLQRGIVHYYVRNP